MADRDEHLPDQPACPTPGGDDALPRELRGWMQLLAATSAVEQRLHTLVKERLDVSHDEFLILCLLADQPEGLRMTRVAELLGRPKTRLTYQIACLQHAGLVTRASVCGDKRGITVILTDKARTLLHESSCTLATTVRAALSEVMGPTEVNALCNLLPELAGAEEQGGTAGVETGTGAGAGTEMQAGTEAKAGAEAAQ
ncbi:MarR family transcriptional regulator [Streptomyces roseirectus]|uniref:MarR family transcriptional regulator n=1 Tax=Streptomyces roseirectus TaxID=2768066 RepID=A0A7H0IA39_9ACTN|nr:MarR family transcriptional regulator [Streptomyces roseirectus]QNP69655.1 MarR family transcriptional regulator [Streptomyces roseirectus]